jgi:hypothetical protein
MEDSCLWWLAVVQPKARSYTFRCSRRLHYVSKIYSHMLFSYACKGNELLNLNTCAPWYYLITLKQSEHHFYISLHFYHCYSLLHDFVSYNIRFVITTQQHHYCILLLIYCSLWSLLHYNITQHFFFRYYFLITLTLLCYICITTILFLHHYYTITTLLQQHY